MQRVAGLVCRLISNGVGNRRLDPAIQPVQSIAPIWHRGGCWSSTAPYFPWPISRSPRSIPLSSRKTSTRPLNTKCGKQLTHSIGASADIASHVAAPVGKNARAQLPNVGVGRARHRFLAFLDLDRYLHEDAYDYLVREAIGTRAAIAFGGILCRNVRVFDRLVY